ncbi:thioredoxin family protein [Candidatus Sumerlaeota bacterium]|nr:thioredoxin family protein [Candidatus Sumerlaeota bacterium]
MKTNRTFTVLAIAALCVFLGARSLTFGSVKDLPAEWLKDFDKALEQGKGSGKPILAVFSAEWCGPCQHMVKEVYPRPEVKEELKNWVAVYVDEAADPDRLKKFEIEAFPTFVLLSSEGVEEDRFVGGKPAKSFVQILQSHKRLPELKAALEKSPNDAKLWKELGDIEIKRDHNEEAITAYENAAKNDPQDKTEVADDLFFYKAMPANESQVAPSLKKFDEFETKFPKSPLIPQATLFRAWIRANTGREAEALTILKDGIKRFPESDQAEDMKNMAAAIEEQMNQPAQGDNPPEDAHGNDAPKDGDK